MKKILKILVLCITIFAVENKFGQNIIDYYKKEFESGIKDKTLKIKESEGKQNKEIPKISITKDLKVNTTLFKLDVKKTINSCSSFPYSELLSNYIVQYYKMNRASFSYNHRRISMEIYLMIFQILYYKNADFEKLKTIFKKEENELSKNYIYEPDEYIKQYIDIIYGQIYNSDLYNFDYKKYDEDLIKKYSLGKNFTPVKIYDFIINILENNSNEEAKENILKFIKDKKKEFVYLYHYIDKNNFIMNYEQFNYLYLNEKSKKVEQRFCLYITPLLDLIDYSLNDFLKPYEFGIYPYQDNKILFYIKTNINKNKTETIERNIILYNDNIFFDYNKNFKEIYNKFKKNPLDTQNSFLTPFNFRIPKNLIYTESQKKVQACAMTYLCEDVDFGDDQSYTMDTFLQPNFKNDQILKFARLLYLDENLLKDKLTESFTIKNLYYNKKFNDENELKAITFILNAIEFEILNTYNKFYIDISNYDKLNQENKDLFKLIEMNYYTLIRNKDMILDNLENELKKEIFNLL